MVQVSSSRVGNNSSSDGTRMKCCRAARRCIVLSVLIGMFIYGVWKEATVGSRWENAQIQKAVAATNNKNQQEDRDSTYCETKLNSLDLIYDSKRQERQYWIKNYVLPLKRIPQRGSKGPLVGEKNYFDMYEPEATCLNEERFGSNINTNIMDESVIRPEQKTASLTPRYAAYGDGPKFICDIDYIIKTKSQNREENCLVYSVGSNNDISFEKSVYDHIVWSSSDNNNQQHCEIHTFDPTLITPFIGDKYAIFHPWGFGNENEHVTMIRKTSKTENVTIEFTTNTFDTIYNKKLNHTGRTIDIFKIDCEKCEYDVMIPILELIASGKLQINQLLIELHAGGYQFKVEDYIHKLIPLFDAADKVNMRIFHKERNHWGCDGYKCIEYSFISESYLRQINKHWMC